MNQVNDPISFLEPSGDDEARGDHIDAAVDSIADELLTAVMNNETFEDWTFENITEYLSPIGWKIAYKFMQESLLGVVMSDTRQAFTQAMERAAYEIAEQIYKERNG